MKHAVIAASLLLALAGRASAQPGVTPPIPAGDVGDEPPARSPLPPLAPAPVMAPEPKEEAAPAPMPEQPPQPPTGSRLSEGTALMLSVGGTVVSWGLLVGGGELPGLVGVVLAPSFGNWYAGHYFTRGMAMRLPGTAMLIGGALIVFGSGGTYGHDDSSADEDSSAENVGGVIALTGLVLLVAGTVDDIAHAGSDVRKKNRERGWDVGIAPMVAGHTTGLALGGRF